MLKLIQRDLRCGLIRWQYLIAPVFFIGPFLRTFPSNHNTNYTDYLMSVFAGNPFIPPHGIYDISFYWLLSVCGCLLINLDYILHDLTGPGHQVLLRSGTKRGWFLSKCLWNLMSCLVYFAVFLLTALVFSLLDGAEVFPIQLGMFTRISFRHMFHRTPTATKILVVSVLLPFLTVFAMSLLQMVLCLYIKPILAFLCCLVLPFLAVAVKSPLILGNGAMWLRNEWIHMGVFRIQDLLLGCLLWIAVSFAAGLIRIKHVDVLGTKE